MFAQRNMDTIKDPVKQEHALTELRFKYNKIDKERLENTIKEAQLEKFVQSLPDKENTFVGERGVLLSGGQRQRIALARALISMPSILVMDEATSALDKKLESKIISSPFLDKAS